MSHETTFQGEVQFLAWGDGPSGPWIKVLLPDSDDLSPFRGMTAAKKGMAGQRLMCVLVEIGDDETPKEAEAPAAKGGELAKLAGMMCADPEFREWLGARTDDDAAQMIREQCGINSRAELDHDAEAAGVFHEEIRRPWAEFNQERARA